MCPSHVMGSEYKQKTHFPGLPGGMYFNTCYLYTKQNVKNRRINDMANFNNIDALYEHVLKFGQF